MKSARGRLVILLAIGIGALAFLVWVLQKRSGYYQDSPANVDQPQNQNATDASPTSTVSPSPEPTPTPEAPPPATTPTPGTSPTTPIPLPQNTPTSTPPPPPIGFVGTLKLIVPVAGIQPNQLQDTFADSRSEGRVHDAIDIPAPAGTAVLAATDGEVLKLSQSELGGTTIYQLSADKKLVFYYAHLQRYADGIYQGKFLRQGEVIAYVGDTGNAGPGNYHLHFSIAVVADPKRYWEGVNINPYPLLRR